LGGDVCSRLLIIIKSHDLHASDIRKAVGENFLPRKGLTFSFFLVLIGCASFGLPFFITNSMGHDLAIIVVQNLLFICS